MRRGVARRGRAWWLAAALVLGVGLAQAYAAAPCTTVVIPTDLGFGAPTAIESLNPMISTSTVSLQLEHMLFRPLFRLTPRYTIDFAASLASDVQVLEGGRAYRVTMRPWLWSDGVPVSADDAAYALELIRRLGKIYPRYGSGGVPDLVESLTVLNAHQFVVRMTRTVNPEWFELNGLNYIVPVPRHAWGAMGVDEMWARQTDPRMFAISDGPFTLETIALSRYISLVANPRYGGKKPEIQRLVLDFLEGGDSFQAFASGEIDISNVPFALVGKARTLPEARMVTTYPAFTYFTLELNLLNGPAAFLRDVRVRQAMADAIDQASLIRVVFHGLGAPLYGPVPTQPDTYLSPATKAGHFAVGYDPARARALLGQAGFVAGADGIMRKDGTPLRFEVLLSVGSSTGPVMAQFLQRNLAAVGIDMRIKQMEFNQILALAFGPPSGWQAAFINWTIDGYPDGQQQYSTDGGENIGHYSDKLMDRLVEAVNFGADRQPLFAWQDYASAQQPAIFLTDGNVPVIARPGIGGVRDFINPDAALYPEELTITDPDFCHAAHDRHPS